MTMSVSKLLVGISCALPFLLVRVIYSVLSGYSPSAVPGQPAAHNSLSKFSSQTGSWGIYLVMSVLMELIVIFIYIATGLSIRLQDDGIKQDSTYGTNGQDVEMSGYGRRGY